MLLCCFAAPLALRCAMIRLRYRRYAAICRRTARDIVAITDCHAAMLPPRFRLAFLLRFAAMLRCYFSQECLRRAILRAAHPCHARAADAMPVSRAPPAPNVIAMSASTLRRYMPCCQHAAMLILYTMRCAGLLLPVMLRCHVIAVTLLLPRR